MIEAAFFENKIKQAGFDFFTGVPCSILKPLINYVIDSNPDDYIIAASEGEAVAIAAGAYLAGRMPVVMLQNSGLGNTINPLTSLNAISNIPCLILVTLRGEEGKPDAPQHALMGKITHRQLDLVEVPNQDVPEDSDSLEAIFATARQYIEEHKKPYGLILKKGTIAPYDLKTTTGDEETEARSYVPRQKESNPQMERSDAIKVIGEFLTQHRLPTVATTGKISRELFGDGDRDHYFYMVGSMGGAAPMGLGIALNRKDKATVILDGDGAVIMKMGVLSTIGHYSPKKLIHIILDNGAYESTGGQSTVSNSVDFLTVGAACGYKKLYFASTPSQISDALKAAYQNGELSMIHIRIKAGSSSKKEIGRPTLTPPQVTERFRQFIQEDK